MNKKILSALLMGAFFLASTSMFVSCKDYDDDIKNLQAQIDKNTAAINAIQTKINEGGILESVTKTDNGIRIVINGQSYDITNGQDGAPGAPGTPGTVWTIGTDGYWYKDGVKQDYKAIGQDGATPTVEIKDGYWYINNKNTGVKATGNDGVTPTVEIKGGYWYINGVNTGVKAEGQPGTTTTVVTGVKYYVPNPETGTFWIYNDGDKDPYDSKISYVSGGEGPISGITAVKTSEYLYLYGVEGGEGALKLVTISLSADLKGLVFVPHLYLDGIESIEYPWIGDTILFKYDIPDEWKDLSHHTSETGDKHDITFPNTAATDKGFDYINNKLGRWYDYTQKKIVKKYVNSSADKDDAARIYWRDPNFPAEEWIYGPSWEVEYHLNPSSAKVDYATNAPSFNVLEPDVVYYNTRAAASALGITSPEKFYKIWNTTTWRTGVAVPDVKKFDKDGKGIVYVGIQIAHPDKLAPWPTDETINPNGNTNSTESYPAEQAGGNKPFAGDKTVEAYGDWSWYGYTRYKYSKGNTDNTVALQMNTASDEHITSDYALLVPTHVQLEGLIWDKKPMYVEPKINQFAGGPGNRNGDEEGWAVDEKQNCTTNRIHIWDSPQEAIADPDGAALELMAQDEEGLDLKPYLGIHYLRENLKKRETAPGIYNPHVFDIATLHYGDEAAWGLHYEFELVDYIASSNVTRDSRYACFKDWIKNEKKDEVITGWNTTTDQSGIIIAKSVNDKGQTINTRSTVAVDREPLVRVMLKNEKGDVLLDGYILIHINYTPLNQNVLNYDPFKHKFNLCDPITHMTTWAQFSKWILQDALGGRFKVDADMDNTGMEILSFDDYFWAICKEDPAGTVVSDDDKKYVTPKAYPVDVQLTADSHKRGYQLRVFNFGTDIYGKGGRITEDSKTLVGDDGYGLPPTRGFASEETSNAFEDKELGSAVYYPNGEGPTNHIFSWSLSEEEIEYLTHDENAKDNIVTVDGKNYVKVVRWFAFGAKDVAYEYAHRDRDVNNYSSPYPYVWVKMTYYLERDKVTLKYKEKIDNYWFNYQTGLDRTDGAKSDFSGIIFDIWAPGNIAKPDGIRDLPWDNYISSTMTADGVENHFTLTKTEGDKDYCGHAKYFFAPKTYTIRARTQIKGYADAKGIAEYVITPQNGATVTDSKGYREEASKINRTFGIPAALPSVGPRDYRNTDTWNMLFCKYVPEKVFETYKNSPINRNGAGIDHCVDGKNVIAPASYTNMNLANSEWWMHPTKSTTNVKFLPNEVNIKTVHQGHKWDPADKKADIQKDEQLKDFLQKCAIKYNDGVFNDTILYAKNVKTGEYTPIARFKGYEQNKGDQSTWENAGYLELIHYLPIDATAADVNAGRAIENLVCYDVLNALGYPLDKDGKCDFDHARKFINKQMRAWVGVIANNGCDVALYVEQEKYDPWSEGDDIEVEQSYWTATGLTKYIAAPKDDHKYTPVATFLTSWERPINLRETAIEPAIDANTNENIIYLLDYLKLFDWRGDKNRQGYMYEGNPNHWWFWGYYNVKGIMVDMSTSAIWTNMHQADPNTFVKLNQVTTKARLYAGAPYWSNAPVMFGLGWDEAGNRWEGTAPADDWKLWSYATSAQESAIEQYMGITPRNETRLAKFGSIYYENNGDNVEQFDVIIPITIFYEWGSQKYFTKWHIDTTTGREQ